VSAAKDSSQWTLASGGGGDSKGEGHCSKLSELLSSKKGVTDGAHSIVGQRDGSLKLLTG
jgi:hypothetical protein